MSIQKRKKDHVEITVQGDVNYDSKTGFETYSFRHNALPENDLDEIDLTSSLLGRRFSFPIFISSMTGGYSDAGAVNTIIAEFCEAENLPFGVGSQRAMIENPTQAKSFTVVRDVAPNAFIAANIGGAQLIGGMDPNDVKILTESISADAVIVHLNPLQELMQPEGDHNFEGIEDGIRDLKNKIECPLIVKETGAGISKQVAKRLLQLGADVIDVAGAGGTSWAKVENRRDRQDQPLVQFDNWGISTVRCIDEVCELMNDHDFELIASGGIRSSFDIAKSIALGATFTASAQPVIKAIMDGGYEALKTLFETWKKEMAMILTLTGCQSVRDLTRDHLMAAK